MKKYILLAALIIATSALFAQGNMPNGFQKFIAQKTANRQKQVVEKHKKLSEKLQLFQFRDAETENTKNIRVQDSMLIYATMGGELYLYAREKVMARDGQGNMTEAIRHFMSGTVWVKKDTISASYFNSGIQAEIWEKPWNSQTHQWANTSYYIKYDENGNLLKSSFSTWNYDYNVFEEGHKHLFEYDENGNRNKRLDLLRDNETNDWINSFLAEYTYDENGFLSYIIAKDWDSGTSQWVNNSQFFCTCNNNGDYIEVIQQAWNGGISTWENLYRHLFTYDDNQNVTQDIIQTFDDAQWNNVIMFSYEYDTNNNKTLELMQAYEGGAWFAIERYIFTYNSNSDPTMEKLQYGSGYWENVDQYVSTYAYDPNGNITRFLFQIWDNGWMNWGQTLYTYTNDGNLKQELAQQWYDNSWNDVFKAMYFWSEFTPVNIAVIDNCKMNVYPNPATDKITISGNEPTENSSIKIYSVSGKLVKTFCYT